MRASPTHQKIEIMNAHVAQVISAVVAYLDAWSKTATTTRNTNEDAYICRMPLLSITQNISI